VKNGKNGTFWCIVGAIFADCSNLKSYQLLCFISVYILSAYECCQSIRGRVLGALCPSPENVLTSEWKMALFAAF